MKPRASICFHTLNEKVLIQEGLLHKGAFINFDGQVIELSPLQTKNFQHVINHIVCRHVCCMQYYDSHSPFTYRVGLHIIVFM